MKPIFKFIFTFLAAITISGFVSANPFEATENVSIIYKETVECKFAQCSATAKSTGKRCKHCVSNAGDKKCWQHK